MLTIILVVDQNAESVPVQILKQAGEYHRQRAESDLRIGGYGEVTLRNIEKAREVVSGINKNGGINV